MSVCEVCGKDYDRGFEVVTADGAHSFDRLECAMHRLAPSCSRCGCEIVGYRISSGSTCCAQCVPPSEVRSEVLARDLLG